jgi:hypothetical protein
MNKDIFAGIKRERSDWFSRQIARNVTDFPFAIVAVVFLLAAVGMARAS